MQIATWNVNSIKVRLEQVLGWLRTTQTDALVMQETKTVDELFPKDAFEAAGYLVAYCGQKTYNGVALAVRSDAFESIDDVTFNISATPIPRSASLRPRSPKRPDGAFALRAPTFPTVRKWVRTSTSTSSTGWRP